MPDYRHPRDDRGGRSGKTRQRAPRSLDDPCAWCGGTAFPRLASDVDVPQLADDIAKVATAVVRELMDAEQDASSGPVHGDLTPYNPLWNDRGLTGILDGGAAGFGGPAVDMPASSRPLAPT